jgi:hypothetical protein
MGYHRAGFDVTGIDLYPQPNYPFEFIEGDALGFLADPSFMARFDAAAGSPPCQGYSRMSNCRPGLAAEYPKLVGAVRDLYRAWGGPWIIENVAGAGLAAQCDLLGAHGVVLCPMMFGRDNGADILLDKSATGIGISAAQGRGLADSSGDSRDGHGGRLPGDPPVRHQVVATGRNAPRTEGAVPWG